MPVTFQKEKNYVIKRSSTKARERSLSLLVMLLTAILIIATASISAFGDIDSEAGVELNLNELLLTETVVIEKLREYLKELETRVAMVKRKTLEIKAINDDALNDTHKYVNNPLNAITILTRLSQDWRLLSKYAEETFTIEASIAEEARQLLIFPTEDDLDDAVGNLLRIQDIYKLAPERLAVGEVNGVKLGSVMSWSDCLEIGRKSEQNGDYLIAKFWMETALGKLPPVINFTAPTSNSQRGEVESKNGRFEILEALLNAEFDAGHAEEALDIVNELMALKPSHKRIQKAKEMIQRAIAKQSQTAKKKKGKKFSNKPSKAMVSTKSTEESLIIEICRDAARSVVLHKSHHCKLEHANLPHFLLKPIKVEYLRLDPLIAIYHDAMNEKQIESLLNLVEVSHNEPHNDDDAREYWKFTKMGMKKLQNINALLAALTGHTKELFTEWQLARRHFESGVDLEQLVQESTGSAKYAANALFNLKRATLGGAIAFPQLELSVDVPAFSLLYWDHLNEFRDYDYRTKQYICPIIAGSQITAFTSIKCTSMID